MIYIQCIYIWWIIRDRSWTKNWKVCKLTFVNYMGYFKSKPWCICCKNKKKISTCFIGQLKFRFCWTVKWWRNQDIKKNLINSKNLKSNKSVQNKYFRDCFIAHFQFHFFFLWRKRNSFFCWTFISVSSISYQIFVERETNSCKR